MARDISLDNFAAAAIQQHDHAMTEEASRGWSGTGEAVDLAPGSLPIARVQRAWERKPASPLARTRFRVGKVWKRNAVPTALASATDALSRMQGDKRSRLGIGAPSPMRAVKKLCLDARHGLGAQVSRWDARPIESPVRKIVTRAGAARNEDVELVELREEDEQVVGIPAAEEVGQEVGEVTIEILDEQGNMVEIQEEAEEEVGSQDWEDVSETDGDAAEAAAEEHNVGSDEDGNAQAERMVDNAVRDELASATTRAPYQAYVDLNDNIVTEDDTQIETSEAGDRAIRAQPSEPDEEGDDTRSPGYAQRLLADDQARRTPNSSPGSQKLDEGVWVAQIASSTPQSTSPFADLVLTPNSIRSSPRTERASSAPLEEQPKRLSPEKSFKPRLSDDTALLQAFINRAQEDKSSRRVSVTQRESLSNRRDSDTVRQALASPAKPAESVLGDLDPNSPSPRKIAPSGIAELPTMHSLALATTQAAHDEADSIEDPERSAELPTTTRRSNRGRRKPQVLSQSVYSAPSQRIQIRGANANVDLKKSEAQELTLLTRTNTRKNKQGSVLPKLRLLKMPPMSEGKGVSESGHGGEGSIEESRKGVKWNEQLASFFEPGSTDTSGWSDDGPEERMPWERPALPDDSDEEVENSSREEEAKPEEPKAKKSKEVAQLKSAAHTNGLTASTPVPASETPSKPKIRKLKAPRTASTPGQGPAPVREPDPAPIEQAAAARSGGKPSPTIPKPKRSRIATPAKGLTNAPSTDPNHPAAPAPAPAPEKIPTAPPHAAKKRPASSKLPAPASVVAPAANASALPTNASIASQGKENFSASPPKRPTTGPQGKLFAPRFDFLAQAAPKGTRTTTSLNLQAQQEGGGGGGGGGEGAVPGLSSPAKKGRGRLVFGPGMAGPSEAGAGGEGGAEVAGLKSPAKKRSSRRMPVG